MPRAGFLSFRFGPTDGVSVVTRHWRSAFESLGFSTVTVGSAGADRRVSGFDLDPAGPPDMDGLVEALADCDLVVVENLLTIPLNVEASFAAASVLEGRRAILHHHDPAWQRERFAEHTALPPTDAAWRHVTITHETKHEMAERGIDSVTIYNGFAEPQPVVANTVRSTLGIQPDELLAIHPVRAIKRKNLPVAIEVCESLGATYWLLGPVEEDFHEAFNELASKITVSWRHEPWGNTDEFYEAADLVLYPSVWEGFGNPPIEASLRMRPVLIGEYPFARELARMGFEFFESDDIDALREEFEAPNIARLEHHRALARQHFSLATMTTKIKQLLDDAGWMPKNL